MATKPTDVLAQVMTHCRPYVTGPRARQIADGQLDALKEAGYIVVPRLELGRIAGYIATQLPGGDTGTARTDNLITRRGQKILATLRGLLDVENDEGDDR